MRQLFSVIKFEYNTYRQSKAFIIITVLLSLLIAAALSIPFFIGLFSGDSEPTDKPPTDTVLLVNNYYQSDISATVGGYLGVKTETVSMTQGEVEAAVDADDSEYFAGIIINDALDYTYITKTLGLDESKTYMLSLALQDIYRTEVLSEAGLSVEEIESVKTAYVTSDVVVLQISQGNNFLFSYVLLFLLYFAILMYGQYVAISVATEKSNRAMELLITSAKPRSLIFGKVIGTGLAGLTQFSIMGLTGVTFYFINKPYFAEYSEIIDMLLPSVGILLLAFLFFILGFFMYAFLYAAFASFANKVEDANSAVAPLMLFTIASFMVSMFSMSTGNVDTALMKFASYFPLSSPMAMFVRVCMSTISPFEVILSIAILFASLIGVGFFATAVYRIGVLMYGQKYSLGAIIKALRK